MITSRALLLALAFSLSLATPALAVPITFEIESGSDGGFGYSSLHDSDDNSPMSGAGLGSLSGLLRFDYDLGTDTYAVLSSTVSLASAVYDFEITGGSIAGDGGGTLEFTLTGAGLFAQMGSLVFQGGAPVCCGAGGPNFITGEKLRLWGMSDIEISSLTGGPKRLGADLGGSPVPEPSAAAAFGIGILIVSMAMRRDGAATRPSTLALR